MAKYFRFMVARNGMPANPFDRINKIISGFNLGLYRIARLENLINLRGDVLLLRLRRLIKSLVVKMADAPGYDFLFG
jgi:hypothetical protein